MSHLADDAARLTHTLILPDPPSHLTGPVKVWREAVSISTYETEAPNRNPMFLEKRVYQGSSGNVYPLPFIDRIASQPKDRLWDAIHLENEYLRLMVLPEIGGRIHIGYDKISGYDFFYRQNVIKPALVGLAGPWISGGVEFNWPQHHRPATFMPVETSIEERPDGACIIWCSDHDPMLRMKGMHGVCLRPGAARLELEVRLFNRTPYTQTFLWWANVATRVHERYQSFFPQDVRYVADHAKRAVTSFPLSDTPYYGVDYPERARTGVPPEEVPNHFQPDGAYAPNDLSWYANIPVPTSYMVTGTSQDFFGGYDHKASAGIVHVADHHIAPGKKQWTWGNQEFGYAWDRNLTDSDGPYIELMAGVYTDNQPDFSYLAPWETKTFQQCWYPLRGTGVPQMANDEAALHVDVTDGRVHIALVVTADVAGAEIQLLQGDAIWEVWREDLRVVETFTRTSPVRHPLKTITVRVIAGGRTLIAYDPADMTPAEAPTVAQEPPAPEEVATVEELYLIGVHLDQYRHATRRPELYWQEALRRDAGESRCLQAMGSWHLRRGELDDAVRCCRKAITRLTRLNPNPYDGEAFYTAGIALRLQGLADEACDSLYKATWNAGWRAPAYFALAEIDCCRSDWKRAEDHVRRALRAEADHLNARHLLAYVLRQLGRHVEADATTHALLALDSLDVGARWMQGVAPSDGQTALDLAYDLLRSGRRQEAIDVLDQALTQSTETSLPMLLLTLADVQAAEGEVEREAATLRRVEQLTPGLCFPSRLDEMLVLQRTLARHPDQALPWYLLGLLLRDRRRYPEAIHAWEQTTQLAPTWPTPWRNLGIAFFNVRHDRAAAVHAYERAFESNPEDGRVLYERDQLWKRIGRAPEMRLEALEAHPRQVRERDDLSIELATLYNQLGRADQALALLLERHFQPWEGGEGLVLGQFLRARMLLGRNLLDHGDARGALEHFQAALRPPRNLSEAMHLLANHGDVYYWLGRANDALARVTEARSWYEKAARQKGDFQQMSVRAISDMSFWRGLALQQLCRFEEAEQLFHEIDQFASDLERTTPKIDYFATSLPTMLLFEEGLEQRTRVEATFLRAQARLGLRDLTGAEQYLREVLRVDASHAGAQDLLTLVATLPAGKGGR